MDDSKEDVEIEDAPADSELDGEAEKDKDEPSQPEDNQKLEDLPEVDEKEVVENEEGITDETEQKDEKPKQKKVEKKKEPTRWTRPKRPDSLIKTKFLVKDVVKFIEEMKQKITQEDMSLRVIPSLSACRFELPIDMSTLKDLSPLKYISKHCRPAETRRKVYTAMYEEYLGEKNTNALFASEIRQIYEKLFNEPVLGDEMLHLRRLLDLDLNQELNVDLFIAVSCLMERIVVKNKGYGSSQDNKRNVFEVADYCSLNGKLHGIEISPHLRNLLEYIRIM